MIFLSIGSGKAWLGGSYPYIKVALYFDLDFVKIDNSRSEVLTGVVRYVRVSREVWVESKEDHFPTNNILSSNRGFTVIFYTYLYKQRHLAIILKQHSPSFTFSLGLCTWWRKKIARYTDRIIWVYYRVCSSWLFFDAYFLKIYLIYNAIYLILKSLVIPFVSE